MLLLYYSPHFLCPRDRERVGTLACPDELGHQKTGYDAYRRLAFDLPEEVECAVHWRHDLKDSEG